MEHKTVASLHQCYLKLCSSLLRHRSLFLISVSTLVLTGCVQVGAPAFTLVGSFIPYWMVCAAIGLVITIIVRIFLIKIGIDDVLPARLLVYLCLMLTVSFLSSLLFFMG
ncbi:YtcA family lipoprotein [Citrobacter sp. JGM124]|uniref:YtcA family lipoprotein n=1 Tax=Citrobacter sp. JGM124 TaxID=2799789 RepID=UPI001BA52400|nr:YtcA family lipoprotein [Citrobacter sp. JGM124]MBS0849430.1 hypothetical protein [Citrobacter sp. JGM124]